MYNYILVAVGLMARLSVIIQRTQSDYIEIIYDNIVDTLELYKKYLILITGRTLTTTKTS